MTWHAGEDQLRRYLADDIDDVGAWSLEAHLDACGACRGQLARLGAGTPVALLVDAVHERLHLPDQDRARLRGRSRQVWMLLASGYRVSWLIVAGILLFIAVVLDGNAAGSAQPAMLIIAPVLPLIGVTLGFGRHVDPMYEMTLATSSSGLRLLLWRTAGVLAVTVPAALVVGALAGRDPALWLLPCLGLTAGALALGTTMEIATATAAVGTLWTVVVGALTVGGSDNSVVAAGPRQFLWALVAAGAAALFVARRDSYNLLETL